jgi:hypothetical protein
MWRQTGLVAPLAESLIEVVNGERFAMLVDKVRSKGRSALRQ